MCQCTPGIRTPFCGAPGCTWPIDEPLVGFQNLHGFTEGPKMFVATVHEVIFTPNPSKHTVYFDNVARRACNGPRTGFASPNNIKSAIGSTQGEAIERLRLALIQHISVWDDGADLEAFSFTVFMDEVLDGMFWNSGGCTHGAHMKVHSRNEGWG